MTLLRNVTLTGNCSSDTYSATLDLNGKTVSSDRYYIHVGGGNKPNTLTVKGFRNRQRNAGARCHVFGFLQRNACSRQLLHRQISRVELQAGGAFGALAAKSASWL